MQLRDYQARAVAGVRAHWDAGVRSVCLVAPTGSGKTVMGDALSREHGPRALWLVHRRELALQAAERTACTVASIQGLLRRDPSEWPEADLLVADECHHLAPAAEEWSRILPRYPSARVLGLTATPSRADGSPLGDVFDRLVVAASYSELLAGGHLVPCDVWAPPEALQSGSVAQDAWSSYCRHGEDGQAFVFWPGVADCVRAAADWPRSARITGDVPAADRDAAVQLFRAGQLRSLHTVQVLTEGVDVPSASVCILARRVGHASQYLQIAGRVLRPAEGKTKAILIDLCGSSLEHGAPTEDRLYALTGDPVRRSDSQPTLHQCMRCGWTWEGSSRTCPACGYEPPVVERAKPRVYSLELRRLADPRQADSDQQRREMIRLLDLTRARGWSCSWAAKEWRKLFGHDPPARLMQALTSDGERRDEYTRVRAIARERGYKPGWAAAAYRRAFGEYPKRSW